ncbi:MAG: FtsQ-type POTRA domain-containing protein [Mycobacteriales bacterium]
MTATSTTPAVGRFSSPKRRRRRLWARLVLVMMVVLALVGGGGYVALGTDLLVVKTVRVLGTHAVSAAAVETAAQVPLGTPMVRLDTGALRRRVLARLPGVATVAVHRQWPSTVRLVVTERVAVAAVPHSGRYLLVDRTGLPFGTAARLPGGLSVLQVATPDRGDPATVAGVSVLVSLPADLRALLVRVEATSAEQVDLVLRDRRRVVWGSASDATEKAAVVRVLLKRPGRVIDVSAPGLATVR